MSFGWALTAVVLVAAGVAALTTERPGAGVALVVFGVLAGAVAVSGGGDRFDDEP